MKIIHKVSRADNNTVCGRSSLCGINDFYLDEETESKVWRKVTCKRCLRLKK